MLYLIEELKSLGVKCGENIFVHKSVILINPEKIVIGNNVRIDCLSILSGGQGIEFGNYIHIASNVQLTASGGKIILEDFSAISSKSTVFTSTDDYIDGYLTNPMIPLKYKKLTNGSVILRKHALVGANTVILPNVELGEGCTIGALSLVKNNIDPYGVAVGNPAKIKKYRNKERLARLEMEFLANK